MSRSEAVETAIKANKDHQYALKVYTERLETELKSVDKLITSAEAAEEFATGDEFEHALVTISNSVRPTSVIPMSSLLLENSPFYQDAHWRRQYEDYTTSVPTKAREDDVLTDAVRSENQRIYALAAQSRGENPSIQLRDQPPSIWDRNVEGLDWDRIANKVSSEFPSGSVRTARDCKVRWLGKLHPDINKSAWSVDEVAKLKSIVSEEQKEPIDWKSISLKLGSNRSPFDCMRHAMTRRAHIWSVVADQKLSEAVEIYGLDNWSLVSMYVSEDANPHQCQKRYHDSLDPKIKRGPWSTEEDNRLTRAVEAFTLSASSQLPSIPWQDVALFVPGRTKNQCREHYQDKLASVAEKAPGKRQSNWTQEEDQRLKDAVSDIGTENWKAICERVGRKTISVCQKRYESLKRQEGQIRVNPPVYPQPSGFQVTLAQAAPAPPSPAEFIFSLDTGEQVTLDPLKRTEKSDTPRKKGRSKSAKVSAVRTATPMVEVRDDAQQPSNDSQAGSIVKPVVRPKVRPRPAYAVRDKGKISTKGKGKEPETSGSPAIAPPSLQEPNIDDVVNEVDETHQRTVDKAEKSKRGRKHHTSQVTGDEITSAENPTSKRPRKRKRVERDDGSSSGSSYDRQEISTEAKRTSKLVTPPATGSTSREEDSTRRRSARLSKPK